jgi:hypothetical protein
MGKLGFAAEKVQKRGSKLKNLTLSTINFKLFLTFATETRKSLSDETVFRPSATHLG